MAGIIGDLSVTLADGTTLAARTDVALGRGSGPSTSTARPSWAGSRRAGGVWRSRPRWLRSAGRTRVEHPAPLLVLTVLLAPLEVILW